MEYQLKQDLTSQICYDEDEIDLKELLTTLLRYKKIILLTTFLITFATFVYVSFKTPIYEAKALIEIGSYKLGDIKNQNNTSDKILLDTPTNLKTKLDIVFIESKKNLKDKKQWIESISIPNKSTTFLNVKAQAITNDLAKKELFNLLHYIQNEHQKLLDDIKQKRLKKIAIMQKKISTLQNIDLPINIKNQKKMLHDIKFYKNNLHQLIKEFNKTKNKNSTFALLILTQQKNIQDLIYNLQNQLDNLIKQENDIKIKIDDINQQIMDTQNLLKPYNYKNTDFIGNIITQDSPIKPKKKLIVIVAFITGLILSIFLVFFIEFIKNFKNEEEQSKI